MLESNAQIDILLETKSYAALKSRYAVVLSRARNFLSSGKTAKTGGSASQRRKDLLIASCADCPQCGLRFRGKNHNTEHIHPKALGGGKSDNGNRIQICTVCNNARGSVMAAYVGSAPFSKHYPENWKAIERYLIWSELTIDEGLAAGSVIPDVHELFIEARFAGEIPKNSLPHRAYDRFSTWSEACEPNYSQNRPLNISQASVLASSVHSHSETTVASSNQIASSKTFRSVIARSIRDLLDRVFDYAPEEKMGATPEHTGGSTLDGEPENTSDPQTIDKEAIFQHWRTIIQQRIESDAGTMPLGDFWDMVAQQKENSGTGWRSFEKALGVKHKASMPVKATELLQQMDYAFVFKKMEQGYLILFNTEEE